MFPPSAGGGNGGRGKLSKNPVSPGWRSVDAAKGGAEETFENGSRMS
jgi:hypothetical protein